MKCNNCGWLNKDGATNCEKCTTVLSATNADVNHPKDQIKSTGSGYNATIVGQQPNGNFVDQPNINNAQEFNVAKTIRGEQPQEPYIDRPVKSSVPDFSEQNITNCPDSNCKYPLTPGAVICPQCNRDIRDLLQKNNPSKAQSFKGTIDPYAKKGFSLRPIVNGEPAKEALVFDANSAVLNRENTVKENMTITSKEQAEIKLVNGEWFITDKSEKQTTFVRPDQPLKLKKGDIILLGDTKFIFE
jgi:hypothetical protein